MRTTRTLLVVFVTFVLVAAGAQAAQAKATYSVSLSTSTTSVDLGGSVRLSGTVSPKAAGKSVSIQRRYGSGSWKTITTTKLSSTSKFAKTITPTTGGPTSYRVTKSSTSTRSAGTSPTRSIDVYRWRNLTSLPLAGPANVAIGTWTMNGNAFPASASYTLSGSSPAWDIAAPRCLRIRTYVGIDADSPDGTTGTSQLLLDFPGADFVTVSNDSGLAKNANPRYVQKTFPAGHTLLTVAGGISTSNPGTGYLTLGTPQVYCNS